MKHPHTLGEEEPLSLALVRSHTKIAVPGSGSSVWEGHGGAGVGPEKGMEMRKALNTGLMRSWGCLAWIKGSSG